MKRSSVVGRLSTSMDIDAKDIVAMELSFSVAARNRHLGKAVRRIRPRFEELLHAFSTLQLKSLEYEGILVLITDTKEPSVFNVQENSDGYYQVIVGIERDLPDDELADRIGLILRRVAESCPFPEADRESIGRLFDRFGITLTRPEAVRQKVTATFFDEVTPQDEVGKLISELNSGAANVIWYGAAANESVAALEKLVGQAFPRSFRSFLTQCGGGGIVGKEISGIEDNDPALDNPGSVLGDTNDCRQQFGLPEHLIVISANFDGGILCLDLSKVSCDECPVIICDAMDKSTTVVSPSFLEFFRGYAIA